jgi:hypothetical protein
MERMAGDTVGSNLAVVLKVCCTRSARRMAATLGLMLRSDIAALRSRDSHVLGQKTRTSGKFAAAQLRFSLGAKSSLQKQSVRSTKPPCRCAALVIGTLDYPLGCLRDSLSF